MESRPRRKALRAMLLLCSALLLACTSIGVVLARTSPGASSTELEDARALWSLRSFSHYRLMLRDKRCLQDIEVLNERVVEVAPNRCEPPPRTVSDLFTLIERNGDISTTCIALGCACDDVITVSAIYDSQLGYPSSIEVRVTARPNIRHLDYWSELFEKRKMPDCSVLAVGSKQIRIVSLTPLE